VQLVESRATGPGTAPAAAGIPHPSPPTRPRPPPPPASSSPPAGQSPPRQATRTPGRSPYVIVGLLSVVLPPPMQPALASRATAPTRSVLAATRSAADAWIASYGCVKAYAACGGGEGGQPVVSPRPGRPKRSDRGRGCSTDVGTESFSKAGGRLEAAPRSGGVPPTFWGWTWAAQWEMAPFHTKSGLTPTKTGPGAGQITWTTSLTHDSVKGARQQL
jgi:hypothetical protein